MSDQQRDDQDAPLTLQDIREETERSVAHNAKRDLGLLHNDLSEAAERDREGREVTMERIIGSKWNAVYNPMPENPSPELVEAVKIAAAGCAEEAHLAMQRNHDPEQTIWEEGGPDAHEYFEEFHLAALRRLDEVNGRGPEGPTPEKLNPAELFRDAGRATTDTPQQDRERDLAEVTAGLVKANGMEDHPDHAAFTKAQAALGDAITAEADPSKRAALRDQREAAGHDYAADLSERLARGLKAAGHDDDSRELQLHAATRREIAAELRQPGGNEPSPQKDFAETAREVGREALGRTAEVVFVAEGPSRDPQDIKSRAGQGDYRGLRPENEDELGPKRPELGRNIRPEMVNDLGGSLRTTAYNARPNTEEREAAEGILRRQADESTQRQETERRIQAGEAPARPEATNEPQLSAAAQRLKEHKEAIAAKDGGEKTAEKTSTRAAFRSFGR